MIKAIFVDFYGTIVFEDGEKVSKISDMIYKSGSAQSASQVGLYWWESFKKLFEDSYNENFRTQRELETESLVDTINHFGSSEDGVKLSNEMFEYWVKPPVFEDAKLFFALCPVPIYVISNIDRDDILKAIDYHSLNPAGVFTSEDARSYKPRKELFEYALCRTGLSANEVVHIGDSLSSDVKGASSIGINTIWINRSNRDIPKGVLAINNLLEVYDTEYFKQ